MNSQIFVHIVDLDICKDAGVVHASMSHRDCIMFCSVHPHITLLMTILPAVLQHRFYARFKLQAVNMQCIDRSNSAALVAIFCSSLPEQALALRDLLLCALVHRCI